MKRVPLQSCSQITSEVIQPSCILKYILLFESQILSFGLIGNDDVCISFWYYMTGVGNHTLNVKVYSQELGTVNLWTLSVDGEEHLDQWNFGRADLLKPGNDIKILFYSSLYKVEGSRGNVKKASKLSMHCHSFLKIIFQL